MKFCIVDKKYMDYLREFDERIPYSDYGEEHYKPCFHPLFKVGDLEYVTYITSPKSKHRHMKNSKDFKKVFISTNKRRGRYFVGAINLNHMFPVPASCVSDVNFGKIDEVRKFKNNKEKSKYISLLKHELESIAKMDLPIAAQSLYTYRYEKPDTTISKRCLDFKALEKYAKKY